MAQGWTIDVAADTITFIETVPSTSAVVVKQYGFAGYNQTDLWAFSAWNPGFGYPQEVEFFSDRLIFAASASQPATLWMSKVGDYTNHGRTVPSLDSDGIVMTINSRQVNRIQELLPMQQLIVMTTSAEVQLTTGADEVVAPGKVGFSFQSFYGSSSLAASVVGETALFLQGRGTVVRDLGYQFTKDGYTGNDLTIYADHLLEGYTVRDMAFQQVPYSAVWLVRSDGKLLCVTYLREQEVVGWSLHETDGQFVSVCTVPEGDHNALYCGVVRRVDGADRYFVECMDARDFTADARDAFFLDCGLTYDGRYSDPAVSMQLSGTGWTEEDALTMTAGAAFFTGTSDVGDELLLRYTDAEDVVSEVVVVITAFVSNTQVTVRSIGSVPTALRTHAADYYEVRRNRIQGLNHLEGRRVSVLADGSVQKDKTVSNGLIFLDVPAAVVHVGIGYRSDMESLDINVAGAETVRDRPKLISGLGLLVKNTRGLKAGPDLDRLEDVKTEWEDADAPVPMTTGLIEFTTSQDWNKNARFVAVQDDPLPATILGLIPRAQVGGT